MRKEASMLLWTIVATADAGKLADDNGFKGLEFGAVSALAEAPLVDCEPADVAGAVWTCESLVGDIPIRVNYMGDERYFTGVRFTFEPVHANLMARVLATAWGAPAKVDGLSRWNDGLVQATMAYAPESVRVDIENTAVAESWRLQRAGREAAETHERIQRAIDDL
jgi:hypothetical protein